MKEIGGKGKTNCCFHYLGIKTMRFLRRTDSFATFCNIFWGKYPHQTMGVGRGGVKCILTPPPRSESEGERRGKKGRVVGSKMLKRGCRIGLKTLDILNPPPQGPKVRGKGGVTGRVRVSKMLKRG